MLFKGHALATLKLTERPINQRLIPREIVGLIKSMLYDAYVDQSAGSVLQRRKSPAGDMLLNPSLLFGRESDRH